MTFAIVPRRIGGWTVTFFFYREFRNWGRSIPKYQIVMGCAASSDAVAGSPVKAATSSPVIHVTPRKPDPDPAPVPENTTESGKEPNGEETARPKSRWAWEFILPPSPTPRQTSLRDLATPATEVAVVDEGGAGGASAVGESGLIERTPSSQRRHSML